MHAYTEHQGTHAMVYHMQHGLYEGILNHMVQQTPKKVT